MRSFSKSLSPCGDTVLIRRFLQRLTALASEDGDQSWRKDPRFHYNVQALYDFISESESRDRQENGSSNEELRQLLAEAGKFKTALEVPGVPSYVEPCHIEDTSLQTREANGQTSHSDAQNKAFLRLRKGVQSSQFSSAHGLGPDVLHRMSAQEDVQESITNDMVDLASELKQQAQTQAEALSSRDAALDSASEGLYKSAEGVKSVVTRTKSAVKNSRRSMFFTFFVLIVVAGVFLGMYGFINVTAVTQAFVPYATVASSWNKQKKTSRVPIHKKPVRSSRPERSQGRPSSLKSSREHDDKQEDVLADRAGDSNQPAPDGPILPETTVDVAAPTTDDHQHRITQEPVPDLVPTVEQVITEHNTQPQTQPPQEDITVRLIPAEPEVEHNSEQPGRPEDVPSPSLEHATEPPGDGAPVDEESADGYLHGPEDSYAHEYSDSADVEEPYALQHGYDADDVYESDDSDAPEYTDDPYQDNPDPTGVDQHDEEDPYEDEEPDTPHIQSGEAAPSPDERSEVLEPHEELREAEVVVPESVLKQTSVREDNELQLDTKDSKDEAEAAVVLLSVRTPEEEGQLGEKVAGPDVSKPEVVAEFLDNDTPGSDRTANLSSEQVDISQVASQPSVEYARTENSSEHGEGEDPAGQCSVHYLAQGQMGLESGSCIAS